MDEMKTIAIYGITGVIIIGIVASYGLISIHKTTVYSQELLKAEKDEIKNFIDEYEELIVFQRLSEEFAKNHEYNLTSYNCANYSRDFTEMMRKLGYDVRVIAAHNKTKGHAYNEITLSWESQKAKPANNYKELYPIPYSKEYMIKKYGEAAQ